MIPFEHVALLALDNAEEARICVVCGEDAVVWGLWLDTGWATGPQINVSAWCDGPECAKDRAKTEALTVPMKVARLDLPDDTVRTVLAEAITDDPMWEGIEYTAEREARIAQFVDEVALRVARELRRC